MALNLQARAKERQIHCSELGSAKVQDRPATERAQHLARATCLHTRPAPIARSRRFGSTCFRRSAEPRKIARSRLPPSSRSSTASESRQADLMATQLRISAYYQPLLAQTHSRSGPIASRELTQTDFD